MVGPGCCCAKKLSGHHPIGCADYSTAKGYRVLTALPLPKDAFDNYEGMAIEPRAGGGLRFWLITDDGHRILARTLLVALDYVPADTTKARRPPAGSSEKPLNETR